MIIAQCLLKIVKKNVLEGQISLFPPLNTPLGPQHISMYIVYIVSNTVVELSNSIFWYPEVGAASGKALPETTPLSAHRRLGD